MKNKLTQLNDGFYLFTTEQCPTCEKLKTNIHELGLQTKVEELDAYKNKSICMELSLIGTPCIVDVRGGKEYDRIYGAPCVTRLQAFFKGE